MHYFLEILLSCKCGKSRTVVQLLGRLMPKTIVTNVNQEVPESKALLYKTIKWKSISFSVEHPQNFGDIQIDIVTDSKTDIL